MAQATDYLALEKLLLARIDAAALGYRRVSGARSVAQITDAGSPYPACWVLYGGARPVTGERGSVGRAALIDQRWQCWTVVQRARDPAGGSAARQDAGALLAGLVDWLLGWTPPGGDHQALRLAASPPARYSDTRLYLPLIFSTRTLIRGTQP